MRSVVAKPAAKYCLYNRPLLSRAATRLRTRGTRLAMTDITTQVQDTTIADIGSASRPEQMLHNLPSMSLTPHTSVTQKTIAKSKSHEYIPNNLSGALTVFFLHPSIQTIVASITCLTWLRLQSPVSLYDVAVSVSLIIGWQFFEYWMHTKLHSKTPWFGRDIHEEHHRKAYYQISIDPPSLIVPVMLLVVALSYIGCLGHPTFLTASTSVFLAGLWYEWSHYLVHTRYVPKSKFLRSIRTHHMRHHCRNEAYWFGFGIPTIDDFMGTNPPPSSVPLTAMAKAAHMT